MKNYEIKKVSVNDTKSVISRNEKVLSTFFARTLSPIWSSEFDAIKLSGTGGYDLHTLVKGDEGINAFMAGDCTSDFLKNRYNLPAEDSTLQDLFDSIPQWAVMSVAFSEKVDGEIVIRSFDLIKISHETEKELAEGYIASLITGYDPIV